MRPVYRYSLSITESEDAIELNETRRHNETVINVDKHSKPKLKYRQTSRLSNIKHTNGRYRHEPDCSYCLPCILAPFISIAIILAVLIIPAGIGVGGYYTVMAGIHKSDYADSFNIEGSCTVLSSQVYVKTYTEEYQQCTGTGEDRKCETKTREYDCSYTLTNYEVNEYTNSTIFPCDIGRTFTINHGGKQYGIKPDQVTTCYTNDNCDEIFVSQSNRHHTDAEGIYVSAAFIFLIAICILGCTVYFIDPEAREYIFCGCFDACADCTKGISSEYSKYKNGKARFYKYQWGTVMNEDDRFDYEMSNWMRRYCKNRFYGKGISVDVESIIYDYLYE